MKKFSVFLAVVITICLIVPLPIRSEGMTADDLYKLIKDLENQGKFPLPVPTETVMVGTFNPTTGRFEGNVTRIIETDLGPVTDVWPSGRIPPNPTPQREGNYIVERSYYKQGNRAKMRERRYFAPVVNSPFTRLQFNAVGPVDLTVEVRAGSLYKSQSGRGSVAIDVQDAISITWTAKSGQRTFSDFLIIHRPQVPVIGAGAFTIPVLPVAVIYEPPPDQQKKSHAMYSTTKYIGTTTEVSFGTEKASTRPVKPQRFVSTAQMVDALKSASKLLQTTADAAKIGGFASKIPYISETVMALNLIANALGKVESAETKGYASASGTSLTLMYSEKVTYDTGPNDGGPGFGDVILYLKNAKFLWLFNGQELKLTLLGCEGNGVKEIGIRYLRENLRDKTKTGLDYEAGLALLKLDPFGDPSLGNKTVENINKVEPNRYEFRGTVDMRGVGGRQTATFIKEFRQEEWASAKEFTTRMDDYRKGWLGFLGIGVTTDETVKFTMWRQNYEKTKSGERAEVALEFNCSQDEIYIVDVYYDRIFGTFAFERGQAAQMAMLTGTVTWPDGKPMSGKTITLVIANKPIVTATNKEGRFEFYSSRIRGGTASLVVDNKVYRKVDLSLGKPISGINIQLQPR